MWTVKCKSGEEKQTALLLMRKFNAYLNKTDKQPLAIKSVIVKEGLRGFIYIEAYKQTHVKAAIDEISNLKLGIWKQEVNNDQLFVFFLKNYFNFKTNFKLRWFHSKKCLMY